MKKLVLLFAQLVSLIAVVAVHAGDDVCCSSFPYVDDVEGVIPRFFEGEQLPAHAVPAGKHNYDIIVNSDCYISPLAVVNGNLIDSEDGDWSIYIDPEASVNGTIEEKGAGDVRITVGNGEVFNGNIKEEGPGFVWVWVDGFFGGNIEEQNEGFVDVHVFGAAPAGGPGSFNGNALEKDGGDARLSIDAPGDYNGNFIEEGPGGCGVNIELPEQQPRGNIECKD